MILDYSTLVKEHLYLNEGIYEVVMGLSHHYNLGLVSAGSGSLVGRASKVDSWGIRPYFASMLFCTGKRYSRHYRSLMQDLEKQPQEPIIVDDSYARGIDAGVRIGCETYWVNREGLAFPVARKLRPTRMVSSLAELLR